MTTSSISTYCVLCEKEKEIRKLHVSATFPPLDRHKIGLKMGEMVLPKISILPNWKKRSNNLTCYMDDKANGKET